MAPGDVCHGPRCSLAGLGPVALEYRSCHWPGGSAGSPQCVRPMGCWFFPVPWPPYVCAVSWAAWLLFTGVPARSVVLRLRCPGPLGSCSPVCSLGVLCCVCGVLGHLAPVHWCARWVCCVACAVSRATYSCSPVRPLGVLLCVCGVLGHLAPVHRCASSVCCIACAVSWATWLLFTGVPARCVFLRVPCPGPLSSRLPVCSLGVLCCVCGVLGHLAPVFRCARWVCCSVCGVLGHLAPVHRCACSVCCFVCAVSWATWLPVHRCARSVGCVACAVSWATWLLFTGVPARCVVMYMRCPRPPGSCSPVCPLGALCCVCGVLGHLAPVHLCARSVCCFACAASWASWLLFTGVPTPCVVFRVRCPGPHGSCSLVCLLGVLCCVCGVLGHPAPVHRCARSVLWIARAVSWATWLPFTGVPARCVVLRVRCPGPPGPCSPVCPLDVFCCVYGVLGHLASVHRRARSVLCFACAVFCATWLLFTGVPARCVILRVRCAGPPGSCSPVFSLGVLCCVCGVLGHLAPVHRCARSVGCVACTVSWAAWLLYTGVLALCAVLWVARVVLRGRGVAAGRSLVHPDGGFSLLVGAGYPPGAHSSIRMAAVCSR